MPNNTKAQAMMIVITILALLFVVGVAFFSLAQVERASSARHLESLKARYIAEAGVVCARRALALDRQTNLIDSLEDLSFTHFTGQEADVNQDSKAESRWFSILDSQGNPLGRFALIVTDEASKINLNTTSSEALAQLFSQLKIDTSKANTAIHNRPFNAVEQLAPLLERKDFLASRDFLTTYSAEWELDLERKLRAYLNSSSAPIILEALLDAGLKYPFQAAANLKDASDADLAQTRIDEYSRNNIIPTSLAETGSWVNKGNSYEAPKGGDSGKFIWSNLAVDDGDYFCFFYAPQDSDCVGKVYLEQEREEEGELLYSGEGLTKKVKVESGSLVFNIKPALDLASRFSHIELVSTDSKNGLSRKIITGTEGLVINELMVRLTKTLLMDNPVELESGEIFAYTFSQEKPGNYYLVVLANKEGGLIGDVTVSGRVAGSLYDKDYFPYSVETGQDAKITLSIKNNSLSATTFKGIEIHQQPDAEFIELLNISGSEIDLSDFSLEVYSPANELVPGWPSRIPQGTKIAAYQHMAFTVDNNDGASAPSLLKGNNISFQGVWDFSVTGLVFDEYQDSLDKTFDLLPDKGGIIILKDNYGRQVDAVEYLESQVNSFTSLERSDPASKTDQDQDGLFDGWFISQAQNSATPESVNQNEGMYTRDEEDNLIKHSPGEALVFNQALTDFSQIKKLSNGKPWEKLTILDIARMSDRFAAGAINLDLNFVAEHKDDAGEWEFKQIPRGNYFLSLISDGLAAEGQKLKMAYSTGTEEDFSEFSTIIFSQGVGLYGRIILSADNLNFQIKIINDTEKALKVKSMLLEPQNFAKGRINVNTAGQQVLNSVLGSDALAQTVLNNRPIGAGDGRRLGKGELFLLDEGFLGLNDYLTVKSDAYEINCRGEYFIQGKTQAFQQIRTVVERAE